MSILIDFDSSQLNNWNWIINSNIIILYENKKIINFNKKLLIKLLIHNIIFDKNKIKIIYQKYIKNFLLNLIIIY